MKRWQRLRRLPHTMKFPVLAAALVPLVLNVVLLTTYFLYDRTQDVFRGLEKYGAVLAHQLAVSSEYGLISGNTAYLNKMVTDMLGDQQVVAVAITDEHGQVLVSQQRSTADVAAAERQLQFNAPVYLQQEEPQAFSLLGEAETTPPLHAATSHARLLGKVTISLSTEAAAAEQQSVIRYGVSLGLLSLLIAAWVGLRIANNFARRIDAIKSAIRRIRDGRYDQPVALTSVDDNEFFTLANDVDALASELADAKAQAKTHMLALTDARTSAEALVDSRTKDLAVARDAAINANDDNRKLIKEMNRLLEQERQYIAREIHDQLNALLVTIRLGLQRLQKNLHKIEPPDPRVQEAQERIAEMLELVTQGYTLAREIIHRLRPEVIDAIGLKGALEEMVQGYNRIHPTCRFDLSFASETADFGDEANIAIYRIVQEALNNVAKHANASRVHISIERQKRDGGDVECISITDNGAGVDPESAAAGIGILSMRERARGLGGTLEIRANVGGGTRVEAVVPVPQRGE